MGDAVEKRPRELRRLGVTKESLDLLRYLLGRIEPDEMAGVGNSHKAQIRVPGYQRRSLLG
jgi:hypothetical protein